MVRAIRDADDPRAAAAALRAALPDGAELGKRRKERRRAEAAI